MATNEAEVLGRSAAHPDEAKRRAIVMLFGTRFLDQADAGLLWSIERSGDSWGDLLLANWRIPAVPPLTGAEGSATPPLPTIATSSGEESASGSRLAVFDPKRDAPVGANPPRDVSREQVREFLVRVIAEKTGYPPETFDDPLDFETDLGIDSIKQVEAMSEVRQHFELSLDENFQMRDYPTLDAAADYIVLRLRGLVPDPPVDVQLDGSADVSRSSI